MNDPLYSTSDSDSFSPAFPSLSCNVDSLPVRTSPQPLTMKETDARLDELRRENLNLKLKLYFLEQQKGSTISLNSHLGSTTSLSHLHKEENDMNKEILKKNAAIRRLQMLLEDKDLELEITKADFEQFKNECDRISNENLHEIQELQKQLRLLQNKPTTKTFELNSSFAKQVNQLKNELEHVKNDCEFFTNKSIELEKQLQLRDYELQAINENRTHAANSRFDASIHTFKFMLDEKDVELETIKSENERLIRKMAQFESNRLKESHDLIELKNKEIAELKFQLSSMQTKLESKSESFNSTNVARTASCANLTIVQASAFDRSEQMMSTFRRLLNEKEDQVDSLQKRLQQVQIESKDETLEAYKFMLNEKENELDSLRSDFDRRLLEQQSIIDQGVRERDRLLNELESYKARKNHIEKAITKQLKKTDRLLKKAKTNLIEI